MAEAYITNLQADTCSNDRRAKQQALSSLHATMETALVSTQDSQQDIQNMVVGVVPDLLLCTQNPMDQVREESVQLLTRCVQSVSVVPVTVFDTITHQGLERFQPGVEPTEETRLAWVMLVHTALLHTQPQQLETVLAIVQRTLVDTFPGVQKQGACLLATAARHAPVLMGYAGERPVKMTLGWLYHHHAAVRVLGLEPMRSLSLCP
ncbi:hypothetical protein BDF14DRAFT_1449317 [Spinellus fusiger]|nr:hypothetical protein BDF14DRAFT_1449317 [Spinellus fusiger]